MKRISPFEAGEKGVLLVKKKQKMTKNAQKGQKNDPKKNFFAANLFVKKIDAPGRIKRHPSAIDEAFRLGRELASTDTPHAKSQSTSN